MPAKHLRSQMLLEHAVANTDHLLQDEFYRRSARRAPHVAPTVLSGEQAYQAVWVDR